MFLDAFEFDFYMVYWEDIQSDSGWRTLKEIQKSKQAFVYLLVETKSEMYIF